MNKGPARLLNCFSFSGILAALRSHGNRDGEVVRDGHQKHTYFRDAQTGQTCSHRPPVDQEVGVETQVEGSRYFEGVAWEMLIESVSELSDSQRARILLAAHVMMEIIRHPCGSLSERS